MIMKLKDALRLARVKYEYPANESSLTFDELHATPNYDRVARVRKEGR